MSSVKPVTEISDESLSATCQRLPSPGRAKRRTCGHDDAAKQQRPIHADADRGLELAARNGEIGGAKHFRLIGARDDADGERPSRKGRHADEALVTESVGRFGQKRRSAEIDEIDDEQFRQAPEQSGVGLPQAACKQPSRKPRPGDEPADCGADEEAARRDEKRHRGAFKERQAPAALTEAEDRQIAHPGAPLGSALFQHESALKALIGASCRS